MKYCFNLSLLAFGIPPGGGEALLEPQKTLLSVG